MNFFSRFIIPFLFGSICSTGVAQVSFKWEDHFAYSNVNHILEINGFIFCSAENGLFIYDPVTEELEKISKITDLKDVGISSFEYSEEQDLLIVGYKSGRIDMLGEEENHYMLEIPLNQFYIGDKGVNHIQPYGDRAIVSGEFGVATFDLIHFEFMETTYFTQGGASFGVKESAVLNDFIYTASDQGIFFHPFDEFTANFTAWEQPEGVPQTSFQHITAFKENLIASSGDQVYRFDGNNWLTFGNYTNLRDIVVNGNVLSIVQANSVHNFDENLNQTGMASFNQNLNTGIKIGNLTYGGSSEFGLVNGMQEIYPDGPYNNKSWQITAHQGQVWISPGEISGFYNPAQNSDGFFYFNGLEWDHFKSEDINNAKDIVDIEVNPNDLSEFYVSSFMEYPSWDQNNIHIGFFRFKDGQIANHYNADNSPIKKRERIGGTALDDNGNLWVAQNAYEPGLKAYIHKLNSDGSWQSIELGASSPDPGIRKPIVYNGYGMVALPRENSGVKITDMQNVFTIDENSNRGDLPSSQVPAIAMDKNGVLWIGTILGLRVLSNPIEAVQSESFQAQPIVIEQNGIPEALLTDVQINAITVDDANQKWVGTNTGGVYCFSEDGTETIFHFTKTNSPLPSDQINGIYIDKSTGVVYFATDKGVVSYHSDVIDTGDSFGDVYSYPNPVRPGFQGEVTIKGLPNGADVRIVDVVGNLIYKTKANGGVAKWDTRNFKGKKVASGIYLVLMTNKDASETKQTKIAVVR